MLSRRSMLLLSSAASAFASAACSQTAPAIRPDLYNCEGCEAAEERDPAALASTAQIAAEDEPGERLLLSGTVFQPDGKTPAEGVIIYLHQTNDEGLYAGGTSETLWSRRHGRLRGWVKSGPGGTYSFYTIKPAPYPSMTMPAHIHLYIKEPGHRPYYIDDVVFDGEFGVDSAYRAEQEFRGGGGIVTLETGKDGTLLAVRDIVLERHPD